MRITKEKADIQSRAAKMVYQVSGEIFKIADAISGVIIAADSQ